MHSGSGSTSERSGWYVVAVLMVIYVFSFIDRQILSLLVTPIRRDLGISDTQMSLLMGFTFAVFYTLFGIPLGRLADTRNRRNLIAAGLVTWSLFTAGCGLATSFAAMLVMRIGVGIGEASLSPAAYSLIADYFPIHRRATALSVYGMGIYLGGGLANLLGGLVIRSAGSWQTIFFAVGLPGLLLVFLLLSIREPERQGSRRKPPTIRETLDWFSANRRTVMCHNFGGAMAALAAYSTSAWLPTFLIRSHGWTPSKAGMVYGTVVMIFGSAGIASGGRIADWLRARGAEDANLRVMAAAPAMGILITLTVLLAENATLAVCFLCASAFLMAVPFGVGPAAITQVAPPNLRGQAAAVYLFVLNLVGLGAGPTVIALTTDYWFRDDAMLRYSLALVVPLAQLTAAVCLWSGLAPFRRSLKAGAAAGQKI